MGKKELSELDLRYYNLIKNAIKNKKAREQLESDNLIRNLIKKEIKKQLIKKQSFQHYLEKKQDLETFAVIIQKNLTESLINSFKKYKEQEKQLKPLLKNQENSKSEESMYRNILASIEMYGIEDENNPYLKIYPFIRSEEWQKLSVEEKIKKLKYADRKRSLKFSPYKEFFRWADKKAFAIIKNFIPYFVKREMRLIKGKKDVFNNLPPERYPTVENNNFAKETEEEVLSKNDQNKEKRNQVLENREKTKECISLEELNKLISFNNWEKFKIKYKDVLNVFEKGKKPILYYKEFLKIGPKDLIKRYFEENYKSVEDMITPPKTIGKVIERKEISEEVKKSHEEWKEKWISHYSGLFVSLKYLVTILLTIKKEKDKSNLEYDKLCKNLMIEKEHFDFILDSLPEKSLYYTLRKLLRRKIENEKRSGGLGPDRITFYLDKKIYFHLGAKRAIRKRKKPYFHLGATIQYLIEVLKKKHIKKQLEDKYRKKGSKNPKEAARKYLYRHPEILQKFSSRNV